MRTLLIAIVTLLSFTVEAGNKPPVILNNVGGTLVATTSQNEAINFEHTSLNNGVSMGTTSKNFYTYLTQHYNFNAHGGTTDGRGTASIEVRDGRHTYQLEVTPDGSATLTDKDYKTPEAVGSGGCSTTNPGFPLVAALAVFYLLRRLWKSKAGRSGFSPAR